MPGSGTRGFGWLHSGNTTYPLSWTSSVGTWDTAPAATVLALSLPQGPPWVVRGPHRLTLQGGHVPAPCYAWQPGPTRSPPADSEDALPASGLWGLFGSALGGCRQ